MSSPARKMSVRLQRADLIPRIREAMLRRHVVTVHRRPSDAAVIDFALATTVLIECRENTPVRPPVTPPVSTPARRQTPKDQIALIERLDPNYVPPPQPDYDDVPVCCKCGRIDGDITEWVCLECAALNRGEQAERAAVKELGGMA